MPILSRIEIANRVRRLREEVIVGDCIDMVPYCSDYDADAVRLRSLPNVRCFMSLIDDPSLLSQALWRKAYERRDNDVMWMLRDKDGRICGTNRLYDIEGQRLEKGSQIVEPEVARAGPVALESEVRVIEIAFNVIGVEQIVIHVRADNTNVISMNERYGFSPDGATTIRGESFCRYTLDRHAWDPMPFQDIIRHWARRYGQ